MNRRGEFTPTGRAGTRPRGASPSAARRGLPAALRRAVHAARRAADSVAVFEDAVPPLARALPFDLWAGVLLDPVTLLNVGGSFRHGVGAEWMPRMLDIEYRVGDANQMPHLSRMSTPVGSLASELDGRLDRSVRYRDIYRPQGLADEMRVLLRDAGRVWGALVLVRAADRPPFSPAELELGAALSGALGRALRRSLAAPTNPADGPTAGPAGGPTTDPVGRSVGGLLAGPAAVGPSALTLLSEEYAVLSQSPGAEARYGELAEARAHGTGLPASAYSVAAATLRSESGGSRVCVPTLDGGLAAIEGWRLDTADGTRVALTVGPAVPSDRIAALIHAYGLTPRECEVLAHVLRGSPTAEIADRLALSPYTVQDHLKAVFDKTGVRSRKELAGRLFFRHYLPGPAAPDRSR
ncbi:LuxR C-terminal-related transcriptional regulator [Kitasatospora sp. NPDC090308]|uniref:LuxR C-terminal-related transcriptional regulator n=1 Tax=Kitasatospora sp. NPDC090308 TaxID=3364082 RepID=UPI0037FDABDB